MNIEHFIGYTAAIFTTLAFVPQVWKTYRTRDTSSISLSMYAIFCIGVFLWLIYGYLIEAWPVIVANAITFILAGTILWMKCVQQNRSGD